MEDSKIRLALLAFATVFISEMGDKTQITTMLLAGAKPAYVMFVALGSAMALMTASFLEVILGAQVISRVFRPETVKILSGMAFLAMGLCLLLGIIGRHY